MPVIPQITLNNGVRMPVLGLGVWQMREGAETVTAVRWALDAGYRLFDTAKLYGNERSVGKAIRESGIPRGDMFVTTKLWPSNFFNPETAFERSFGKLDIGYIDLYLIHFPASFVPGLARVRKRVWNVLEKLYARGRVRAIGISNYSRADIDEVLAAGSIAPAVNQIRFNPFSYKGAVLEYCRARNIAVEAYSPLTRARHLGHPLLREIAAGHGRTPAQVLIRWALQHGTVVIPKSSHRERIVENARVFDFKLGESEMAALDRLT